LPGGLGSAYAMEESMALVNPDVSLQEIVDQRLHHGHGRFVNPLARQARHSPFQFLKWKLFSDNRFKKDYAEERVKPVTLDWEPILDAGGVSVTFINHASQYIIAGKTRALVDPIFFGLPGFIKDFSPLVTDGRPAPAPDVVLITHGHFDHLDKKSLATFGPGQFVVSPLGYDNVFDSLDMANRTQLDWLETVTCGDLKITLLPCNHWTMRNPLAGANTSLWGSYVIETAQGFTVYVSGDTAYFPQFQEIGRRWTIDLAIFNLGAYEPRWFMAQSHMNPEDTVQAFLALNAARLMVVHWGTFRLGDEPVHFPPIELKEVMRAMDLAERLIELSPGGTVRFDKGGIPIFDIGKGNHQRRR